MKTKLEKHNFDKKNQIGMACTSTGGAIIQLSDARLASNAGENIRSSSSSSYSSSLYQRILRLFVCVCVWDYAYVFGN